VPTIASTANRLPVAASLFGLWSGGTFASVHTNQLAIAATTATRSSLRRRITSGARPGRTSTKADPATKTALTTEATSFRPALQRHGRSDGQGVRARVALDRRERAHARALAVHRSCCKD
jgi:hypothetical protein